MRNVYHRMSLLLLFAFAVTSSAAGQQATEGGVPPAPPTHTQPEEANEYVLGPGDQIKIWALGLEEISNQPIRIDPSGSIALPLLGRLRVGGLTLEKLKGLLVKRLAVEVRSPVVSVDIVEFGSQPVSVVGAVATPGVHQLRGRKTLVEMLSLAGGIRADAGPVVKITRTIEQGMVPLPRAKLDDSGKFSVAEVKVKDLLSATQPAENILIRPQDTIAIPTAEMIYVMGAVRKPGAFPLNDKEPLSVLQALSMAEGLGTAPSPQNAKILRVSLGGNPRTEVPVNLTKILTGKAKDVGLQPNDILFVPDSRPKRAGVRALEAAIQTASGVVVWRGARP